MKIKTIRILSLCLASLLLLLTFSGCQPTGPDNPEPVKGPKLADLTPTETLVLYISEDNEWRMRPLIDRYTALYSVEVEVVCVEGSFEEYAERVAGDLAGGGGPDVLFLDELIIDIAKAAQGGNFLDLTDIMAGDEAFSEDDYVDHIFDAGRFGGRLYTVPTTFYLPLYLSAQTKLEELGFDWEGIGKTSDFLEEMARLTPYAGQNVAFAQMMESKNFFTFLFWDSGVRLLDYENNAVLPDERALRDFLHAYKMYFPYDYDGTWTSSTSNFGADFLNQGEYVFWPASACIADLTRNIDTLQKNSSGYAFRALPSETGEVVGLPSGQMAIRSNAENKLNAYNFIKMMLSRDIQHERFFLLGYVPIHKEVIKRKVYGTYVEYGLEGKGNAGYQSTQLSDEELDALIETITGVDRFTQSVGPAFTMMFESMLPFFKDEKSYDDCLAELRNKLTFYLSE